MQLRRLILIAALLATTSGAFSQTTQEQLTNLANRIAEQRARVEALSDEVQQTREQYNERVRSLSSQIADVEIQINREGLRLDQINQDLESARALVEEAEGSVTDLEPIIRAALDQYRNYVNRGMPFQLDGRRSEIDNMFRLLAEGNIEEATVLTRVWNTVESEYRLTEESGLFRQTITVAGEEQLAEVARLGMVLMYFKTFDDRYGYVVPGDNGWTYELAADREEALQIEELFEGLRRNLRQGFFDLPFPYDGGAR